MQNDYEKIRLERIRRNKELLQNLGLGTPIGHTKKKKKPVAKKPKKLPGPPTRRSLRLSGDKPEYEVIKPVIVYEEELYYDVPVKKKRKRVSSSSKATNKPSKKKKRRVTVGSSVRGGRVYDSVNGVTCHQCRQKTIDVKTNTCINEHSNPGTYHHFCRRCLRNRYGEDIDEVLKKTDWVCPYCRGDCNCSFCRTRKGRAPTGIMAHEAHANGCASVHHLLTEQYSEKPVIFENNKRTQRVKAVDPDTEEDEAESDIYEVEKIVGHLKRKGGMQYLVQWKGYNEEENTWEPKEHLVGCEDILLAYQTRYNIEIN